MKKKWYNYYFCFVN